MDGYVVTYSNPNVESGEEYVGLFFTADEVLKEVRERGDYENYLVRVYRTKDDATEFVDEAEIDFCLSVIGVVVK